MESKVETNPTVAPLLPELYEMNVRDHATCTQQILTVLATTVCVVTRWFQEPDLHKNKQSCSHIHSSVQLLLKNYRRINKEEQILFTSSDTNAVFNLFVCLCTAAVYDLSPRLRSLFPVVHYDPSLLQGDRDYCKVKCTSCFFCYLAAESRSGQTRTQESTSI